MNNFLLIFNKLLLTVLLLIHLTHFSYAQSCSGNNHANNANGCDDSGNKYDYSFDGMPKPSNWRELDEYQYLLLEVGDDAASAPAPPQRRHERRQVEEQEHEAHTFQEYGGGEHSSGESLDDFETYLLLEVYLMLCIRDHNKPILFFWYLHPNSKLTWI